MVSAAKVRDFSRVLPLARQAGDVIARVDDMLVALKRRTGFGTLTFLGSPIGPALWAGRRGETLVVRRPKRALGYFEEAPDPFRLFTCPCLAVHRLGL